MNDLLTCPDCGTSLTEDSPKQLCPSCLLKQAFASRTVEEGSKVTAEPPPLPEEIADKFPNFEIEECLGRGGMGVVYKALQKSLNRWVAIKILAPERIGEARFSERFTREAQTLALLNHPNIVTVYDYGETDGLFYIVMEFVDGVNVRDLLRDGKIESTQALAIVPPICEALQYAHDKGIVHRDIKPENLLIDHEGRVKIADFGIASLVGATGEAAGTPPYMAPEQGSPGNIDHRADIYALGAVLYEMLTGERPASPLNLPSQKVQIDIRIDDIVLRALSKEPERRYRTANEFRTVVETVASDSPQVAEVATESAIPIKPRSMFRRWWWLFLIIIPFGIGATGSIFFGVSAPKKADGDTGRIVFQFSHPRAGNERIKVTHDVKGPGNTLWIPQSEQRMTLEGDQIIRYKAQVNTVDRHFLEAFVTSSMNGEPWTTEKVFRHGKLLPDNEIRTLDNGLTVETSWTPAPQSNVTPQSSFGGFALQIFMVVIPFVLLFLLMAFLHRRFPEKEQNAALPEPSPEVQMLSKWSLGLFLTGTLGTLAMMTLSPRHDMALIFGGLALLSALVLGIMSWRMPFSKFVVIHSRQLKAMMPDSIGD